MALPKQVEEDLKRIEEIENAIKAPKKPEPVIEDTVVPDPKLNVKPDEPAEVVPTKTPVAEVTDDFQQKYSTLRGKYDAEVPRLHAQVKELMANVDALNAQIRVKAEEPVVTEPAVYVTEADKEEFGEELINVQRRVAQEVGSQYDAQLKQQAQLIAELQAKVDGTGNQVSEMTFDQKLHRAVPDFEQINKSPEWVTWLNEYDPLSRGPRRELAQRAFQSADVDAIVDYVAMFKSAQTPAVVEDDTRQVELEKQVTPTRNASSSQTPVDQSKKVYSSKQADVVWEKIRQLNGNQQYDEALKLEADISLAYVEGRVR